VANIANGLPLLSDASLTWHLALLAIRQQILCEKPFFEKTFASHTFFILIKLKTALIRLKLRQENRQITYIERLKTSIA
jgi:hypothetical protein